MGKNYDRNRGKEENGNNIVDLTSLQNNICVVSSYERKEIEERKQWTLENGKKNAKPFEKQ